MSDKLVTRRLNAYFGENHALHDINVGISANQVTAIIGPSGCGKSTLVRCYNRMHEVVPGARVDGEVLLDGEDIYASAVDPVDVRRRIGMVFQRPTPFPTMTSLSDGQQQRLCVARALAVKPEVLLMDEPCSALDPISTARIEELLLELKENYTIVIVTHNMQQAARCSDFTAFPLWLIQ